MVSVAFRVASQVKISPLMTQITRIFTDRKSKLKSWSAGRGPHQSGVGLMGWRSPRLRAKIFVLQAILPMPSPTAISTE